MFLSIIIPLYNEEDLIIELLSQLIDVELPEFVNDREIIIVDDNSTDNSYQRVADFIQDKPTIQLHKHSVNSGKGAAVKTGISKANGDVFLIQDADLELSPKDIPSMLNCMNELNIQFVNGSRYLSGVNRPLASYKRYLANKLFTFFTSILINVHLTDMACGYKLMHRDLYNQLQLKENGFGFEAELILKALRIKRNNIAEVPVQYFPRNKGEGKKLGVLDGVKILWVIIKYGLLRR